MNKKKFWWHGNPVQARKSNVYMSRVRLGSSLYIYQPLPCSGASFTRQFIRVCGWRMRGPTITCASSEENVRFGVLFFCLSQCKDLKNEKNGLPCIDNPGNPTTLEKGKEKKEKKELHTVTCRNSSSSVKRVEPASLPSASTH